MGESAAPDWHDARARRSNPSQLCKSGPKNTGIDIRHCKAYVLSHSLMNHTCGRARTGPSLNAPPLIVHDPYPIEP